MKIILVVMTLLLSLSVASMAQEEHPDSSAPPSEPEKTTTDSKAAATTPGARKKPGVLDFEAELIEGERKSPDLFLQLQSGTPNLDAILFQRTNFNDFHNVEKHRRPLYRRYVK